jgi:hypothetical protein
MNQRHSPMLRKSGMGWRGSNYNPVIGFIEKIIQYIFHKRQKVSWTTLTINFHNMTLLPGDSQVGTLPYDRRAASCPTCDPFSLRHVSSRSGNSCIAFRIAVLSGLTFLSLQIQHLLLYTLLSGIERYGRPSWVHRTVLITSLRFIPHVMTYWTWVTQD